MPYVDKEKQKAYMRDYQRRQRTLFNSLLVIFCKKCHAPICVRGPPGTPIPREYRGKMKPVSENGVDKQLCAECEKKEKQRGK